MITQVDGARAGRCIDGESHRVQPGGGEVQVFPCTKRWHQFFSFGDGKLAPVGTLLMTLPRQMLKRIHDSGREQEAQLCIGVRGRGSLDEEGWDIDEASGEYESLSNKSARRSNNSDMEANGTFLPLRDWEGEQLVATRCSNVGGYIEWLFVPYIVEEDSSPRDASKPTNLSNSDTSALANDEL